MVYRSSTLEEPLYRLDEIFANRTTDTTIRDLNDLFSGFLEEFSIDIGRSELILDYSDTATFCISDDMIE